MKKHNGEVEHFHREDGAENRARKLSRKLERPVYAILSPDGEGNWHVGTSEMLEQYPDRKKEICIEHW